MSPAQRRTARKLPLTPQQLGAFDKARIARSHSDRQKAVNAIVSASFSDGIGMGTVASKYVINRLLNGVSVSGNQTRVNFSLALIALIRALQKVAPDTTERQMISSILQIYGTDGSFEVDYVSGERERAIGTIAACAALVRAYNGKLLPATCKDIVSLLRPCATGNRAKWRLGNSCVQIVTQILQAGGSEVVQDACAKNIWQWCEDRKHFEDGLALVLNLLQFKIASQKAVQRMYPDLDSMAKPLASTFETGFSILLGDVEQADFIPLAWRLAVEYAFSSEGQKHLGSPDKFWKRMVVEGLIRSGGSAEKKLLALNLLHVAIPLITNEIAFDAVFDTSLSSLVSIVHSQGKTRQSGVVVKGTRFSPVVRQFMNHSLYLSGEAIMGRIMQSSSHKPVSFLQLFCLWAVRNGSLLHILSSENMTKTLSSMKDEDARKLFCATINEFVFPTTQKGRLSLPAIRIQALGFTVKLINIFPSFVHDFVRIFLFYAVCDDSCYQSSKVSKPKEMKFDIYKAPTDVSLVGGWLPIPSPPISLDVASAAFSKLTGFVVESHNKGIQGSLVSYCYDYLQHMLSWKWLKLRTQCEGQNGKGIENLSRSAVMNVVQPVLTDLSRSSMDGQKSLIYALKLLSEFIGILLLKPSVESVAQCEGGVYDRDFYNSLAQELSQIASVLKESDQMDKDGRKVQRNEGHEKAPDILERITKVLCDICIRSETVPYQIALRVVEEISSFVDDRVIAVLFDSIEEILQTSGNPTDFPAEEESEEDGEDPSDSNDGDSDGESSPPRLADVSEEMETDTPPSGESDEDTAGTPMEVTSGIEGSSDSEIDMDIDDEDPALLEALDRRLVTHMKLLLEEKSTTNRRKRVSELKFVFVRRILGVVEEVAKAMRLRLSSNKDDGRIGMVFLDLHCRLYELALSDTGFNGQFLGNICDIVSKQMLLPHSFIQDKVADRETAKQIADRFLSSLSACKIEKSLSASEVQTISKSAASIVGTAAVLSNNDYEQFLPHYQNLMKNILRTQSPVLRPRLLTSFFNKAPSLSLSLFSTVVENLDDNETTKNQRMIASEIILQLATLTKEQGSLSEAVIQEFWKLFDSVFQKQCVSKFKGWNASGIQNMIQTILLGTSQKFVFVSKSNVETLETAVKAKVHRKNVQKVLKLLRSVRTLDEYPTMEN